MTATQRRAIGTKTATDTAKKLRQSRMDADESPPGPPPTASTPLPPRHTVAFSRLQQGDVFYMSESGGRHYIRTSRPVSQCGARFTNALVWIH